MFINKEWIKSDLIRTKRIIHPWYKPAPFHRQIAHELQHGTQDVAFVLPPQFGKTEIITKSFPAFFLGNDPTKTIITSAYNQDFVDKISVRCSDMFTDPKFLKLFNVLPHPELWNHRERMLKDYNGGMLFTGVGGGTSGNPADLFLLDDLVKDYEDASSKTKQEKLWLWYCMVSDARMQDEGSRKCLVMTRWLKNDLIGKIQNQEIESDLKEKDRIKVIRFGALMDKLTGKIAEKDLLDEIAADKTEKKYNRLVSLWPEKKSIRFLMLKYMRERSVFLTMYQGNPKDLEGNVIDLVWIKYEKDIKSLGELKYSCRGWDFGYSESGDYTVGAKIDVYEVGDLYIPILSNVVKIRKKPSETKEFIVKTTLNDGPGVIVGLETGGTQIAMSEDIINRKELYDYNIKTYTPKNDKISRAMPWILKLEDGIFKLLPGAWNKIVVDELTDFSNNCEHDDIPDAITTAWKILFGGV